MTNRLHVALERIAGDLARVGARFALIGGVAVSVRAEPRLTRDLDLAVAVATDPEAEMLVRTLVSQGYRTTSLVEQERADRLASIRLVSPGDTPRGVVVDLLFASSGIEPEITHAAENIEVFPSLHVPVARTAHLIALKLLARDDRLRPQDADDLRALRAVATSDDLTGAREAVELITQRGFARGRDLIGALDAWLTE